MVAKGKIEIKAKDRKVGMTVREVQVALALVEEFGGTADTPVNVRVGFKSQIIELSADV